MRFELRSALFWDITLRNIPEEPDLINIAAEA
jgi:hypothetical protein